MRKPAPWQNRIVRHGEEAPDQLLASPRNWRIHPKHQQDALSGVLGQVGWVQEILVNERTGFVVDGHLRVALAISRGEPAVPVTYVDLSDEEEALVLATLDPISALAVADKAQLDSLLREIETGDAAVQAMLGELANSQMYGDTSTARDGQGVSSTWDQVDTTANARVVIGELETRLPGELAAHLLAYLERCYSEDRAPIHETFAAIVTLGLDGCENRDH